MNLRTTTALGLLAVLAIASPMTAKAAEMRPESNYMALGAGVNVARDTEYSGGGINADAEHDTGWATALSFGHAFSNGFRAEVEASIRHNNVDKIGGTSSGGKSDAFAGMVNGFYDFATGTAWTPYIGAGLGGANVRAKANLIGGTSLSDSDIGFAAQAIAGVGYKFDDSWTGTLEYRYFQTFGVTQSTVSGVSLDGDYSAHAVMVGLRYTFGAPAPKMAEPAPAPKPMPVAQPAPKPAPAPAPAPEPVQVARNYIVFFDWNKATLTDEAKAILRTAAENAKKGGVSRIQATGHADRSGSDKYNMKLSEKRAVAVQAELAKLGVPTSNVAVAFKGEREPLVQTADGVREPQNRRVEIVFP